MPPLLEKGVLEDALPGEVGAAALQVQRMPGVLAE
jgi:hypothetical protein